MAALAAAVFNEMPGAPEFQTRIAFVAAWTQLEKDGCCTSRNKTIVPYLLFKTNPIWLRQVRKPKF
jgi:hypothetical protein